MMVKFFVFLIFVGFLTACDSSPLSQSGTSSHSSSEGERGKKDISPTDSAFGKFQTAMIKNCNACHGAPGSPFEGITDFHSLTTEEDWLNHPAQLITPGNSQTSKIYNRLTFAKGKVPNENNNMPFAFDGIPVSMTEAEANDIIAFIEASAQNEPPTPFSPQISGAGALAKVKYIVNGGAPTSSETARVLSATPDNSSMVLNREALKQMILEWMSTAASQEKLMSFLKIVLQQDGQLSTTNRIFGSIRPQGAGENRNPFRDTFEANLQESAARTALEIIANDRPFSEIVNTRRHAVTSALLSALCLAENSRTERTIGTNDRTFNDFMRDNMQSSDFSDWRFVNLTQASNNSSPTPYTNMSQFRQIQGESNMPLGIPRVGFFNTPAFQLRWQTNGDNQFRVTTNQTLIAAIDSSFEAGDQTPHGNLSALDESHAQPGTSCYQCHRMLDPMRESFAVHYDVFYRYSDGEDAEQPDFAFQGETRPINNLQDLADAIASHQLFGKAWVGKLCTFANSEPCNADDPEFLRIVGQFEDSNYNFRLMMAELLSSPLVTGQEETLNFELNEYKISVSRRNHYCHALNTRYRQILNEKGLNYPFDHPDVCEITGTISDTSQIIPSDATSRGATGLVQSPEVTPFVYRSVEKFCSLLADRMIISQSQIDRGSNPTGLPCCDTEKVDESISLLTKYFMGLSEDHIRYQKTLDVLKAVQNHALNEVEMNSTDALRQSFIFACSSPDLVGFGL